MIKNSICRDAARKIFINIKKIIMQKIILYDTTLRDGNQAENINFSVQDRINITKQLDNIGIDYIEGGWPGASACERNFFNVAKQMSLNNSKLVAFCRTRKAMTSIKEDAQIKALIEAETNAVSIFGKSRIFHIQYLMKNNDAQENLLMISDTISYLKDNNKEVIYNAEQFFDGYKENKDYALSTLKAALSAGADYLVLCDTNGGSLPFEIENITKTILKTLINDYGFDKNLVKIGIHAHNDIGLAVANSIYAVKAGAVMAHGTINGYGERCGNADLTALIPIFKIKMNYDCSITSEQLKNLTKLSKFVADTAKKTYYQFQPFVGKNAFAHKAGMHISAIKKAPKAYEHIDPELIGNIRKGI
ncbi:MAG: hypothetical protein JRJ44_09295 [Deltaproteobacteria bacterium]|nr:hypothetical protein [Deltaproteobacteria bacterium]